jgi:hypothetical protein
MTTSDLSHLSEQVTQDERPSGIPRPGRFGTASGELFLAVFAFGALLLLALAFYLSAR